MAHRIILILIIAIFPIHLHAQEAAPIRVHIQGVSGRELENVGIALAVPEGIVSHGKVNEKWMEHFKGQIPEMAAEALQPFGYYAAEVTVSSGRGMEGRMIFLL